MGGLRFGGFVRRTTCSDVCTLQEILFPSTVKGNRNELIELILKTLPKRCICRNMEGRAINGFLKMDIFPRIYRLMLLGNTRGTRMRPNVLRRIHLLRMSDKTLLENVVKKNERSMSFAMASFVNCVVNDIPPFRDVMIRTSSWSDYWRNVRLVCDSVFRPAFAENRDIYE